MAEKRHKLKTKQERFLLALLSCPTIKAAARDAGVTEPTAFKYLRDPIFVEEFRQARRKVMANALHRLAHAAASAVAGLHWCLREARRNKDPKGVKDAAEALLGQVSKLIPSEETEDRLAALEQAMKEDGK